MTILGTLLVQAQKSRIFNNLEEVVRDIRPANPSLKWVLVKDTLRAENGLIPAEAGTAYFYITREKNKDTRIETLSELKKFLGEIDTPGEAFLVAAARDFYFDAEVAHFGGRWEETPEYYILSVGKIISLKCPLAKAWYQVTVQKGTGKVLSVKDRGVYHRIFDKSCTNDPDNPPVKVQPKKQKKKTSYF